MVHPGAPGVTPSAKVISAAVRHARLPRSGDLERLLCVRLDAHRVLRTLFGHGEEGAILRPGQPAGASG